MAGIYIYALVPARSNPPEELDGIEDQPTRMIEVGPIAAIASEINAARVRPMRKHLKAHHGVLSAVAASVDTVLPMSFGMIAADESDVIGWLEREGEQIAREAERVAGRVEITVKLKWDVENIFEHFVATHDEIRAARDAITASGGDRETQIQAGELFAKTLEAERAGLGDRLIDGLRTACVEISESNPKTDTEAVNIACLIERDAVDAFEHALGTAAEAFDDSFLIDYSGPFPPHSFAGTASAGLTAA